MLTALMTLRCSRLNLRRITGVRPTGAQARSREGSRQKPDSPAHRMVLPSATAFSQFREAPVPTVPDGVLIPMGGAQGRLLQAEVAFLEQPLHLGRVTGNT